MKITEHIDAIQHEGQLLAAAATRTELDAPIPTCPDWRMRDLVRHVGGVHRWATGYVGNRHTEMLDVNLDDLVDTWPADDLDLIDWFREGHERLVHTLASAPPDLDCYTFLPAPSPLAMWARRQAHETAMHRVDAESPGSTITKFLPAFAVDGVDELLSCFITRPRPRRAPKVSSPRSIHVHTTDTGDDWHIQIGLEDVVTSRRSSPADCTITADAGDLYLLLWNRRSDAGISVDGDRDLLALWREGVRIRWRYAKTKS
jgi:uncharacterized protein (TIGR03083 family)